MFVIEKLMQTALEIHLVIAKLNFFIKIYKLSPRVSTYWGDTLDTTFKIQHSPVSMKYN